MSVICVIDIDLITDTLVYRLSWRNCRMR